MATGTVRAATRVRARRRIAAGSLALGVSSLLAVGGLSSPAGAQAPAAVVHCTVPPGTAGAIDGTVSDFPPDEGFLWFGYIRYADGTTVTRDGNGINTDSTGAGTTGAPIPIDPLFPIKVGFAVYRDLNGSLRWDSGDDTVFNGDGTITGCPQDVTLAPK